MPYKHRIPVLELDDGDKFFASSTVVAHKTGSGLAAMTVGAITGGTGKFAGIRGTIRSVVVADPGRRREGGADGNRVQDRHGGRAPPSC